jgi:predicted phosphodiesterase
VLVIGAVAGIASLALDLVTRGEVGPGRVSVRAVWGDGRTELQLPPLGKISAATHWAPVTLTAEVEQVDLDELGPLLGAQAPEDLLREEVARDLSPLIRDAARRALLTAAVAGALAGGFVGRRRRRNALGGMLGGLAGVGLLLGGAWAGYDGNRFDEARFEGPLERAPDLLATVRQHIDGYADVQKRFGVLGDQVAELYAMAAPDSSLPFLADEVRILHVSDVHSNPLGIEVTRQLADRFDVDAILDTGDLTSFGLPVESQLGDLISQIPERYLFVPGNHDSEANRAALDAYPNVEMLAGTVADVRGVKILGIADPTFTADNKTSNAEAKAQKRAMGPAVLATVRAQEPDLLAVHDPVLGEAAHGLVPVVVAGHTHEHKMMRRKGTVILTAGSTGSTGLGSLTVDTSRSYEAQVLRFHGGKLASFDRVVLSGTDGSFRVERELVAPFEPRSQVASEGTQLPKP